MNGGEGKTHGPLSEWACVTPRGAELTAHELWKGIFSQCQELHLPSYISVSNLAFFLDIFFGKKGEFCSRKKKKNEKEKKKLEAGVGENLATKEQHRRILGV